MYSQYTAGRMFTEERCTQDGPETVLKIKGEPWHISGFDDANARRVAACWNACRGWSTELLEHPDHPGFMARMWQLGQYQYVLTGQVMEARKERDTAQALLREVLRQVDEDPIQQDDGGAYLLSDFMALIKRIREVTPEQSDTTSAKEKA